MPIEVVVALDSGMLSCTDDSPDYCDIGYYQCIASVPDIRVYVDGVENVTPAPLKVGEGGGIVEVVHKNVDGSVKRDGVVPSPSFGASLLRMKTLYGRDLQVDWGKLDCILRFYSGYLVPSMVKERVFKKYQMDEKGAMSFTGDTVTVDPIAHNILVYFELADGESFELLKDGKPILSNAELGAKKKLVVELLADNSTADKFYCQCLAGEMTEYWLPNQGDPPPSCPRTPCPGG